LRRRTRDRSRRSADGQPAWQVASAELIWGCSSGGCNRSVIDRAHRSIGKRCRGDCKLARLDGGDRGLGNRVAPGKKCQRSDNNTHAESTHSWTRPYHLPVCLRVVSQTIVLVVAAQGIDSKCRKNNYRNHPKSVPG
jgi:hypothetical protein